MALMAEVRRTVAGLGWVGAPRTGGELLVVGPSLGTSVEALWGACADRLGGRFDVLGWELPGHRSGVPATAPFTVEELAAQVVAGVNELWGPGAFRYAGDSLGGAVGLVLLVDHPDRVSAATLACTSARFGAPRMWRERAALVRAEGTEAVVKGSRERWFSPGFADREPAAVEALIDALRAVDDESYALACEALAEFDLRQRLPRIDRPLALIAGRDDVATPVADAQRIVNAVPGARLTILDDVAHLAPIEAPDRVAAILSNWPAAALESTA
ncbi:alpha/beta fold hydrolase [Kribbella sp. NPDC051620]|uniref:alpha/beta fold hydrolase n=1 Tax=Kribbella sp. NPDC051620 TaxID=3364120 RepID=UPI00379595C1